MVEVSELDATRCNASEPTRVMPCHYKAKLVIHISALYVDETAEILHLLQGFSGIYNTFQIEYL